MEKNDEIYDIDTDLFLYLKVGNEKLKITDKLINELNSYRLNKISEIPKNIQNIDFCFGKYQFKFNGKLVEILMSPINCFISKEKKNIKVYSNIHLKLLLEKIQYYKPYYINKVTNKKIYLDENEINKFDSPYLDIFETNKSDDIIETIYNNMEKLYVEPYRYGKSTYNYISLNFNKYFGLNINLEDQFYYLFSTERNDVISRVKYFILNASIDNIYAICGPYGIGKTVLSLYLQKLLYVQEKKKSLYINLKYYCDNRKNNNFNEIINTLISECFFLVSNRNDFLELYSILLKENVNIWLLIKKIKKFLENKNVNDYFLIIDQYKKSFDQSFYLYNISKDIKVFLLSSINDSDVKSNLIYYLGKKFNNTKKFLNAEIERKMTIDYLYIQNLMKFDETISQLLKENKNINELDLNFIKDKFGNLPKYVYLYLYKYQNIIELFNISYKKIFENIKFFFRGFSNSNLISQIENKKEIQDIDLVDNLQKVPLKYVNYFENKKTGSFFYEYAFPLIKDVFYEYNNYISKKKVFLTEDNNSDLGNMFEAIVKTILRNNDIFEINGYFEVNEIIKMDLLDIYTKIDKNYILKKNVIFINQKKNNGELFDFAIYKVKENNLILFQVKYKITSKNIKHREKYINSSKNISELFQKKFDITIKNIYLLYITSYKYNIHNKKLIEILNKNQLNCLFYSVENNIFSFVLYKDRLLDPIYNLKCEDSFLLIPEVKYTNIINNYLEYFPSYTGFPKSFKCKIELLDRDVNTKMHFDHKKEYKKFISFIDGCIINNDLKKKLGQFQNFFYFGFGEYQESDFKENIYFLVFSLEKKDEETCQINYKRDIGLKYYNGKVECFLNLIDLNEKFIEKNSFRNKFYLQSFVKGCFLSD